MKNKKFMLMTIVTVLLVSLFVQSVYAASACPKGKECTTRGCGLYSDSNGNSLCDLAEGIQSNAELSDETINETEVSTIQETSTTENILEILKTNILIIIYAIFLVAATIASKFKLHKNRRNLVRIVFLILSIGILGFYFGGCICPIGGLQNLPLKLAGVASGDYLYWLILMLLPIAFILIVGRIFCSSVCPLGAVQEIVFNIGKKVGFNNGQPGLEKLTWVRYIKYLVLVWLVVFTAITGYTLFCAYDPFATLFALQGSLISLILLIIVLGSSLFVSRPWCRIICPYGALLSIINKISVDLLHLPTIPEEKEIKCKRCSGCGHCADECPMDAISIVADTDKSEIILKIDPYECINCKKCKM